MGSLTEIDRSNIVSEARKIAKNTYRMLQETLYVPHCAHATVNEITVVFSLPHIAIKEQVLRLGNEQFLIETMLLHMTPQSVVLDIGAEHGIHTLFSSAIASRVSAIEPDSENRGLLVENLQLNKRANVTVLPYAVIDEDKNVPLGTSGVIGKAPRLHSLITPQDRRKFSRIEEVQGRSLDSLASHKELPVPTIIKIDTEGSEGYVIKGAKHLLRGDFGERPQHIFMEMHPTFLPPHYSPDTVLQMMDDLSYGIRTSWKRDTETIYHFTPEIS